MNHKVQPPASQTGKQEVAIYTDLHTKGADILILRQISKHIVTGH